MNRNLVIISRPLIAKTISELQKGGRRGSERVVLWLGLRNADQITVKDVYVPKQVASEDHFRIPRQGMAKLMEWLGQTGLMIAAQVHSHPFEAFHSESDDKWAIVRHEKALSLVLPEFALRTSVDSFTEDVVVFALTKGNEWERITEEDFNSFLRILP